MRLLRWIFVSVIALGGCHWKGDGSDEFIRDPFQRGAQAREGPARDRRNFGVPEQLVPRSRGRVDEQMRVGGETIYAQVEENEAATPPAGAHGRRHKRP